MLYRAAIHIPRAVAAASSQFSLTLDETTAIVLAAVLVAVGSWSIRKNRELLDRNRSMSSDIVDIKNALIGAVPSPLDPRPRPGLISVVNVHSEMLRDLVADKNTNGGSTTRDAINRIEQNLGTAPSSPVAVAKAAHPTAKSPRGRRTA